MPIVLLGMFAGSWLTVFIKSHIDKHVDRQKHLSELERKVEELQAKKS